MHSVQCAF